MFFFVFFFLFSFFFSFFLLFFHRSVADTERGSMGEAGGGGGGGGGVVYSNFQSRLSPSFAWGISA